MDKHIELPSFRQLGAPDDTLEMVDITPDRAGVTYFWGLALNMALRDDAASLHYHSWLGEYPLWYRVGYKQYILVPLGTHFNPLVLSTARELISPGGLWPTVRRWLGLPVVGRLRLESEYGASSWLGVCWSAGGEFGVDFHRIGPVERSESPLATAGERSEGA
jgi:hypothetical protein